MPHFRSFLAVSGRRVPSLILRVENTRTVYCVRQETERRVISGRPGLGVPYRRLGCREREWKTLWKCQGLKVRRTDTPVTPQRNHRLFAFVSNSQSLFICSLAACFSPSTRSVYHLVQLKRPWNRMLIGCRRRDHLEVNGRMGGLADETVTRVTSVYNLVWKYLDIYWLRSNLFIINSSLICLNYSIIVDL